jgi:NAD(P)-dependent dehydrogenase (short-subunit alcohol dehydrogenase family)
MVALSYVKDRDRRRRGERDGRATALAFAAAGAHVAGADVEEPGAKAVAAEIDAGGGQALPVALDVADSDRAARVLEMDEAAWDRVIRVNLTGAFLMAKAALPAMIARGGGSIVMVASQPGRVASPGGASLLRDQGRAVQLAKAWPPTTRPRASAPTRSRRPRSRPAACCDAGRTRRRS